MNVESSKGQKGDQVKLLSMAQKGDVDAFAALFEGCRPAVHAVASRMVGIDDADDVVMETYLKAWQAVPKFNGKSSMKTWMYRITYNCSIDFIRSRGRRKEKTLSATDDNMDPWENIPDARQPTADAAIGKEELAASIHEAIARLPEEHKAVLLLRFAEDLSYAEIAAATGASLGTVMSRLFYGKRKLKKLLQHEMVQ